MEVKKFIASDFGVIHFSGIGGIGMSGIAEILHNLGCEVQGSDSSNSQNVQRLQSLGIKIFVGQKEDNIQGISVLVRSSAVKDSNPEVVAARKNNIPVILRADMLKEIMFLKNCVTIAGTHGKTTTTSLVAHLFEAAGLEPTVINGGILNSCNTNAYLGKGEWLVAEADESDGSFNKLPANIAIVTNIDPEHMEFYGSFDNLRQSFKNFIEQVPFYGFAVLCIDHNEVRNLMSDISDRKIISYGFSEDAQIQATNLKILDNGCTFDILIKNSDKKEQKISDIFLPMFGKHNVLNTVAAIAVAVELDIDVKIIKKAFANFLGVKRRLTITGVSNDVTIIDDYGHHPTEIKASLKAVREMQEKSPNKGNVIAIFQPHRYSRVYDLFNDFIHSFADADKVFVTDIFAAGEEPIRGIDKKSLVDKIKETGKDDVYVVKNLDNLATELKAKISSNDIVICLGAGDITKYANLLPSELEQVL